MSTRVPFNRPSLVGRELEYVSQAMRSGRLAGGGAFTRRCEEWLERQCEAGRVLLTHSGTGALEVAALLCQVSGGDEVIMPSFTFPSTANAFVLQGARPVFVDVRADTLNMDAGLAEHAVTDKTRAIVPVHYGGVACDMDRIMDIARRSNLLVVEDAAQALGARYRNRWLGTLGDFGCWSFHETKNISGGEGGALAIRDPQLVKRAEVLREHGTNRAQFLRGEVDRYTWVDVGISSLASELTAAYLFAQLENWRQVLERRRAICARYKEELLRYEEEGLVRLPTVPPDCESNGHLFYLLLPTQALRDALLRHLATVGIAGVFHYVPLHESRMGTRMGYRTGQLPVTEDVSRKLVRLPCYYGLGEEEQDLVIQEVGRFLCGRGHFR